jgi:HEAT repeat protein
MKRMLSRRWITRSLTLLIALSPCHPPSSAKPPELDDLRKQLKDPSPAVRKQAALKLAEANDAEAVPVLIDLLAELPADERRPLEEFLIKLAGEWAPVGQLASEDPIARKIHRDAWMAWWRNTDGPALLADIRAHTRTPQLRRKIKQLIGRLGADDFSIREAAEKELFDLGRITLPQLRQASKDRDPETARRAGQLIDRLQRRPGRGLSAEVVRLLLFRQPPGVMEALLAYSPLAEQDNRTDEVRNALALLALRDGKLNAALVRALNDELPQVRTFAVEALIQGGGKAGRQAVRKLRHDDAATVRLPVALALAEDGDKDAVPVLIELLAVLRDEGALQAAEEVLYQLAGDTAPAVSPGREAAEKIKGRDAWAAWWKTNGPRVEMKRLTEDPAPLGSTVICDQHGGRVYEIDRRGKQLWSINNLKTPVDAVVVPGNRVLIAEYDAHQVSKRDLKGNILWKKKVSEAANGVQRLANGNIFIAGKYRLLELDRTGKEIYSIAASRIINAYRLRQGPIVCLTQDNECVLMDTKGTQLKSFAAGPGWENGSIAFCSLDVSPNDRILVWQPGGDKAVEYDKAGKVLRKIDLPRSRTVTSLPNGHLLAADPNGKRVYELDDAGKVVWEHKNAGSVYRARRR